MALPSRSEEQEAARIAAHQVAQDALLVERVLRGDAEAFGELVSKHMRRAFSIAYRILEHREDSEDAVQESFVRALGKLDTLQRGRPFHPWFYRIVVNQALNLRRSRAVRATEPLPEQLAASTPGPERDAELASVRGRLHTAVNALPERQRTIVQLAELEGMSSGEIGEVLELSEGTVRWHLHQARRALRAVLQGFEEEL